MGVGNIATIADALVAHGLSADTPAAAIANAHRADQRHVVCTLAGLAEAMASAAIASPAVVVIGTVVAASLARSATRMPRIERFA